MSTFAAELSAATQYHRAGDLGRAEQLYRQVLAADPGCVAAWRFMGLLALQAGRNRESAEYLHRAIDLDPTDAGSCCNLGTVYAGLGQLDEATAAFQQATLRNPNMVQGHSN